MSAENDYYDNEQRRAEAQAEWEYLTQERTLRRPGAAWDTELRTAYGARAKVNWQFDPPELLLIERPKRSKKGAGTKLLKMLLGICQRHGLDLEAQVAPYDLYNKRAPTPPEVEQLLGWYLRNGFRITRRDGYDITVRCRARK